MTLASTAQQFKFTGAAQNYSVPASAQYLLIHMCGGQGGGGQGDDVTFVGGNGGYVSALVPTSSLNTSTLFVYVGGWGLTGTLFNGAGYGLCYGFTSCGGGGTDVRTQSGGADGSSNLNSRILVSGGGGAAADGITSAWRASVGGAGGGLAGGRGNCQGASNAYGGSQTSGGETTNDGWSSCWSKGELWSGGSCGNGRGGRGGYYGGGGASGAGGGGSSFVTPGYTVLENVQGDPRCIKEGMVLITAVQAPTGQPTRQPSRQPTRKPSGQPIMRPSGQPTMRPTTPTGQPTTAPSRIHCPAGWRHDASDPHCSPCQPGQYAPFDSHDCYDCPAGTITALAVLSSCTACSVGSVAANSGSSMCPICTWPSYTAGPGASECFSVCICASTAVVVVFYILAFLLYGLSLSATGVKSASLLAFSIIPALDIISDLQYLLVTTFYTRLLFVPSVIFVMLPSSMFLRRLVQLEAITPHFLYVPEVMDMLPFFWLGIQRGRPLVQGKRLRHFSFERHDTIGKFLAFYILWILVVVAQFVIFPLAWFGVVVIHLLVWGIWLLFGLYLYQIKMMSVGQVWTFWFRVWRSKDKGRLDSRCLVDTEVMNEALFAAFIFETIPHIILQTTNNQLLNAWSPVAYFSTSLSIFNCVNGLYRWAYYTFFLRQSFDEVPFEVRIGTVTLKLEKATHLEGMNVNIQSKYMTRSEAEVLFAHRDVRFEELKVMLKDAANIRDPVIYNNGRVFLLPMPVCNSTQSEQPKDTFLSRFAVVVDAFLSRLAVKVSLGRELIQDVAGEYIWLQELGREVQRWEDPSFPVLSDLLTNTILQAFAANDITSEGRLHSVLCKYSNDGARVDFIRNSLNLSGMLTELILVSYFRSQWDRLVAEGKGADYVYPDKSTSWVGDVDSASQMTEDILETKTELAITDKAAVNNTGSFTGSRVSVDITPSS